MEAFTYYPCSTGSQAPCSHSQLQATHCWHPVLLVRYLSSAQQTVFTRVGQRWQDHVALALSPVWVLRCAFRWLLLPYTLVHPGCPHLWLFALSEFPLELPNLLSDESLGGGVAGLSGLGTTSWRTLVRSARIRAIMNMEALGGGEVGSSLIEVVGSPFTLRSRGATPTLFLSS